MQCHAFCANCGLRDGISMSSCLQQECQSWYHDCGWNLYACDATTAECAGHCTSLSIGLSQCLWCTLCDTGEEEWQCGPGWVWLDHSSWGGCQGGLRSGCPGWQWAAPGLPAGWRLLCNSSGELLSVIDSSIRLIIIIIIIIITVLWIMTIIMKIVMKIII